MDINQDVRQVLEKAIRVDASDRSVFVNLHVKDEILTITAFDTREEADAQRELIIDSLAELFRAPTPNHDVRLDNTWNNLIRLTCYSDGCNHATLLRQPFMTDLEWQQAILDYHQKHPSSKFEK